MAGNFMANSVTMINAPVEKVWQALVDPALITQYLFGTDTRTDWKKGSPITWSGTYPGKSYEDKGTIIDIVPQKLLPTTHYSPLSGKEDIPENYHHVGYDIRPANGGTEISITQDKVSNENELKNMEENWGVGRNEKIARTSTGHSAIKINYYYPLRIDAIVVE